MDELRGSAADAGALRTVNLAAGECQPIEAGASMFEVRARIEPLVSGDTPERLVVYLPRRTLDDGSVLMEVGKAGRTWTPKLRQRAQNTLRRRFTQGRIDEFLAPGR